MYSPNQKNAHLHHLNFLSSEFQLVQFWCFRRFLCEWFKNLDIFWTWGNIVFVTRWATLGIPILLPNCKTIRRCGRIFEKSVQSEMVFPAMFWTIFPQYIIFRAILHSYKRRSWINIPCKYHFYWEIISLLCQ